MLIAKSQERDVVGHVSASELLSPYDWMECSFNGEPITIHASQIQLLKAETVKDTEILLHILEKAKSSKGILKMSFSTFSIVPEWDMFDNSISTGFMMASELKAEQDPFIAFRRLSAKEWKLRLMSNFFLDEVAKEENIPLFLVTSSQQATLYKRVYGQKEEAVIVKTNVTYRELTRLFFKECGYREGIS